ncbi:transcription factor GTE9-like isoform X1 [Vicia villosa]|uniref:transcription factor GTE9-like isoform X1 n=1 Tax=Vicia villosa TaxID=3911 RepID=UPI00273AC378|nr:transcription factor GTE9-like isoform X1 [Vicia villosa]XP_058736681.1 transcription factor GTE9-like isoform X1 [Vicia villosa]XP_058736682.1 transcription factor GTE9-like isoform X1 [Vicia villosa]XP_058736683.1 transcription factor GTE9-like isoform X1 [Vicia villosa]
MAKSRLSGGYCGNAVETGCVSDGSGTSGRMDTDNTVSEEDNRVSRRKCIGFDSGLRGDFGVPIQVVPLSKLTALQRKELANQFRSDLEQVRLFQNKFEMRKINGVTDNFINRNNSQNGPQKENSRKPLISGSVPGNALKPLIDNSRKPSISTSAPGNALKPLIENSRKTSKSGSVSVNKLTPLDQSQKARGWSRGSSGKFETPGRTSLPGTANALLMKDCEVLLKRLMNHQHGWVFNAPVDVVKLNLPDYFDVIKHPMDLGTVQSKIATGSYTSPLEFAADVRLTFSNAMKYNPRGNDVHIMADALNKYFEQRWKSIQKKIPRVESLPLPTKRETCEDLKNTRPAHPSKKRKIASLPAQPETVPLPPAQPEVISPVQPEVIPHAKQVMSDKEKQDIGRELESLQGEIPAHIVDFLKEHNSNGKEGEDDEIEIDIDALNNDTLFKLRKLLDDSLLEKQKNKVKVEVCEIELFNDSGPSNSSLQAFKGDDLADEEVDICGIDSPVSSHPPVVIEKDTTYQTSKCSSSGSSDTDSSGSSDSESDDVSARRDDLLKVPENIGTGSQMDLETTFAHTSVINKSVNGWDKHEDKSQQKPNSCDSDCFQDGECGPTERHVSPDKLYRAALLKSRFADTILKAREKTLTQGVKGDPEKLRRDKEKLEMERRKEKARLQAEAKAAEEARKQEEEAAAADAKRKRELEREAARQALLQMEKTVEINENSQFLEDLEMLRAVPGKQLPSCIDATRLDRSEDGMGSFKFGGSNPLEQLGLYIKVDDEEEEGDPLCVPNTVNDVEEGEID